MPSVQYFTACTLDGFIADENHSLDWLFEAPHDAGDGRWDEFISQVGPMVMGATTYERMVRRHDMLTKPQGWHDFYDDRPCWVFTHRNLPPVPGVDVHFVSGDVRPAYEEMVAARPGSGAPLLPRRITTERLTLREVRHSGQVLNLVVDVARREDPDLG